MHIACFDELNGFYRLEITANPTDCSTSKYRFGNDEYWQFVINYTHSGTDFTYSAAVSLKTFSGCSAGSAFTQDPNIVYRPPLAVIRNPGNIYVDNPAKVVVNRPFRYFSDPFDADTADGSLLYEWKKNGAAFATDADKQNPAFNETIASTGINIIDLKVSESYTPFTAYGVPYVNFTQSSKDKLSITAVSLPFPQLISPDNGASGVAVGTEFRWTDVADALTGPLTYSLYISEDPYFSGCTPIQTAFLWGASLCFGATGAVLIAVRARKRVKSGGRNGKALTALGIVLLVLCVISCPVPEGTTVPQKVFMPSTPLNSGTLYYWKVRATDSLNATSDSEVWNFTTQ